MTAEQVAELGPAFTDYLRCFRSCFVTTNTFAHLGTYCRGLLSDLPRKSVEPIALAAGSAVRTLQEFLTHHVWDHDALLARVQRRIVTQHLPAPGRQADADDDRLGVVGLIDETSVPKKGDKTPGVQRQYCGALGKVDNCIVTVHLAVRHGEFLAMLDSDLFLPERSWDLDRRRCQAAHIPEDITYRPKWMIALEQIERATANGVRFDWLVFDEGYGGKPEFLYLLEVAFCRWGVEHAFRLVKTEIGFGHFEGRSWRGLLRHLILCQAVMLFVAEQTTRLRGEKSAADDGADGAGLEHRLPALAGASPQVARP